MSRILTDEEVWKVLADREEVPDMGFFKGWPVYSDRQTNAVRREKPEED